jgi:hypothetical protein
MDSNRSLHKRGGVCRIPCPYLVILWIIANLIQITLIGLMLHETRAVDRPDLTGDGDVDSEDLRVLLEAW